MSIPVAQHDKLAQWDLYKSTASHILADARHVARKVT